MAFLAQGDQEINISLSHCTQLDFIFEVDNKEILRLTYIQ